MTGLAVQGVDIIHTRGKIVKQEPTEMGLHFQIPQLMKYLKIIQMTQILIQTLKGKFVLSKTWILGLKTVSKQIIKK